MGIQEEKNWKDTPDTHIIWQQTGRSVRKADSNSSSDAHSAFLFVPLTYMTEVQYALIPSGTAL